MTTDHSIYPIYSTVGASSSQPSSSLPSSCLSPLPQSSHPSHPNHPHPPPPPHHPPQSSPSLSPFPWKCPPHAHLTNPHPQRPQAHPPLQLTRYPCSCDPWRRSNSAWRRPYFSLPQDVPQQAHSSAPATQPPDV